MRIATWNLDRCRPGSVRATRIIDAMTRVAADVWVLTESYRDFTPGIGYRLVSSSIDAPDRDAAAGECWVAIWSRLASLSGPVELNNDLERVAAARGEGPTIVVGAVLPWLSDQRDPDLRGQANFLARLAEQAEDWQTLKTRVRSLCLAGDFNQDLLPVGHYYGSADGRNALRATLRRAGLNCLTGEADDPLAGTNGLACIDHICVSGLRAAHQPPSAVWPTPGTLTGALTDHYGVWADVAPV
jgi:hypothetical protein